MSQTTKFIDKCEICHKIAVVKSTIETKLKSSGKRIIIINLQCGHIRTKEADSQSNFDSITFDGLSTCNHKWGEGKSKTICITCNAKRLYDYQIAGARFLERANGRAALFDEMGVGKVSSINTPILTPNGWKRNGDLVIGDLVISSDGKAYPITGLYPQGLIDLYKVYFSDGTSTNCGDEHLWIVNTPMRRFRKQPNQIKAWKDIKNDLGLTVNNSSGKANNKWFIPIVKPIELLPRNLIIEPYFLGLLLGDGGLSQNTISYTTADQELANLVIKKGFKKSKDKYGYTYGYADLRIALEKYNLLGTKSNNKTIPEDYLYNSISNRLAILQGLMDTDGSVWDAGVTEYSTISPYLAYRLSFLVESLGGTSRLTIKEEPKYTYKGEELTGQRCYRITINLTVCPFRLTRKVELWQKFALNKKYCPTRAIVGYDYIGKEEGQCIAIDSPDHSYVTEHCIVTHNTIQALAYLKMHPELRPFLWITKAGIKFQHGKEIIRLLGYQNMPQVIMTGRDTLIPTLNTIASYSIFRRLDREMFINHGYKAVILDECQAIKNPDSSQTGEIRQIVKNIPSIIPLSGTPWKNRGSEFFVVLNMLDPARFNSFEGFKHRWVSSYYHGDREKEGGIANTDLFKEYIKDIAIRRERVDVLPELPLINRTKILCEVDKTARMMYQVEEQKLVNLLNNIAIGGEDENSFENAAKIQQSIMIMRQIVGIAKIPTTVEFAQEFLEDTNRKLVIFVHHKQCGKLIFEAIQKYCSENKIIQPVKITADMDAEERFKVQEDFNKESGPRVLIGSTLASGEGLNLQSCSDCILHERQWNPANEMQAEGRFIRIGQQAQSVNATYIHAEDTVDTIFDAIVEKKRQMFDEVMNKNGYENNNWNESSLMKDVLEMIRSRRKK